MAFELFVLSHKLFIFVMLWAAAWSLRSRAVTYGGCPACFYNLLKAS